MRDLELWRRLTAGDAAPADLLALAAWPVDRRAPYLAAIEPLARHPDAEMRAAALSALAGVRGVAGVRAIVGGLEHEDEAVRAAALDALRATARDAPSRFAHALFHPRPEIRRAALAGELPRAAADLGAYLRADPHCADLAARCPWPPAPLALAFDLHALRHLSSAELAELMLATPTADLRAFLETQRGRAPELVEAYLDEAVRSPRPLPAPGRDLLDHLVVALDAAGNARAFDHFVEAVTARRRRLARRAAASLLSRLATGHASSSLVGVCVALEPRVLRCAGFDRALAAAAAAGLVRFRWPVRPTPAQVDRLVALPLVRGEEEGVDLALGAALAGLWPGNRLARLVAALGQESIIAALLAGDRGWDEVCRLPREKPALELVWLQRIEQTSPRRYVALAGRALAWFAGDRLEQFVEQMPRQHRVPAFLELVGLVARGELGPGDAQLAGVCRALAARIDRTGLAAIVTRLVGGDVGDGPARHRRLAFELAGIVSDKLLISAARLLDDDTAAALVDAIDTSEGLAWEREQALAAALGDRAEPRVREWAARLVRAGQARPAAPPPVVRARRPLNQAERERIATCPDRVLDGALEPALSGPVTGLTVALERRAAGPSVAACLALLGCVDPLDDVVRELDRFASATPDFDAQLDAAAAARWPDAGDLPLLAHARLHRWEAHQQALLRWIDEAGGVRAALAVAEALPGRVAARSLWRAIGETFALLRYRDRPRFAREASAQLAELAADHIDRDIGPDAARILVLLIEAGAVPVSAVRDRILDRAADSVAGAREQLARLIRLEGLPEPPPLPATPPSEAQLIAAIRQSRDLDELVAWCEDARRPLVEAAVLRLLVLGAPGQHRLAALLPRLAELPAPAPLVASIPLWESPAARDAARRVAAATSLPPELQFRLHIGLVAPGHAGDIAGALAAARAPDETAWFRRGDWEALLRRTERLACAVALADSPHHHAYQPAIAILLEQAEPSPEVGAALRRFLEVEGERPLELRRQVALRLAERCADLAGLPLLIAQLAEVEDAGLARLLTAHAGGGLAGRRARADHGVACRRPRRVQREASDHRAAPRPHPAPCRHPADERAVREHPGPGVDGRGPARGLGLRDRGHEGGRREAEPRRAGVRLGRAPRLRADRAPLARAHDRAGARVRPHPARHQQALRLAAADAARRSQRPGRGRGPHPARDRPPRVSRQRRVARAVEAGPPGGHRRAAQPGGRRAPGAQPARRRLRVRRSAQAPGRVRVPARCAGDHARGSPRLPARRGRAGAHRSEDRGRLQRGGGAPAPRRRAGRAGSHRPSAGPLLPRAAHGPGQPARRSAGRRGARPVRRHPPARHARPVRADPKLADLFGGAAAIAAVFGGPEGLEFGEREGDVFGGGLGDEAVQREVERVLDPHGEPSDGPPGDSDRLRINVGESTRFDEITRIEKVRPDEAAHRRIAAEVARHAARLRAYLDELGLRWLPTRGRIQGRAVQPQPAAPAHHARRSAHPHRAPVAAADRSLPRHAGRLLRLDGRRQPRARPPLRRPHRRGGAAAAGRGGPLLRLHRQRHLRRRRRGPLRRVRAAGLGRQQRRRGSAPRRQGGRRLAPPGPRPGHDQRRPADPVLGRRGARFWWPS